MNVVRHRIDHALVMDTDHLRGGGGYAVHAASEGTTPAERLFVSENFGISDFLHDPRNARFYYSVFRIPNGRMAFVRRFANGTRRNGVQNRLFVHTLFLDDTLASQLSYLPWLLTDGIFRIGGSTEPIPFADDPQPLLEDPAFPPLEWEGSISADHTHQEIVLRLEQFGRRAERIPELAGVQPKNAVAAALHAVSERGQVALPQGIAFEQLSLLTWSMLPPNDRATLGWTQHDALNIGGITFAVTNRQDGPDRLGVEAIGETAATMVDLTTQSLATWMDLQSGMARFDFRIAKPDLGWWLRSRAARNRLITDPLAHDEVLLPPLREYAESIRPGRRDPWIDETEILSFLWSLILRAIELGQPHDIAIPRWVRLFAQAGINEVLFREPPRREWLDASLAQIQRVDLLVYFFVAGTEKLAGARATRAAFTSWLLEQEVARVPTATLAQLIERLAIDESELLMPLVSKTIARKNGLRELADALPTRKREIGGAILVIIIEAIQRDDRDLAAFAKKVLLPQLQINDALRIPEHLALSLARHLRSDPATFTAFASYVAPEIARKLTEEVTQWVREKPRDAAPLAQAILEGVPRDGYPPGSVAELAFALAETGESAGLWLPYVMNLAADTDASRDDGKAARFTDLAQRVGRSIRDIDAEGGQQVVATLAKYAEERKQVGTAMHELVRLTRSAWPRMGSDLPEVINRLLAGARINARRWEPTITGIVQAQSKNGIPSAAAAKLLSTFWLLSAKEDARTMDAATPATLTMLDEPSRPRVVAAWLEKVKELPRTEVARAIVAGLVGIATGAARVGLEIEELKRREELPLVEVLYQLDDLLLRNPTHDRASLSAFLTDKLRFDTNYRRASILLEVAAAPRTWPTTRRTIEEHFLPKALLRLHASEWSSFVADHASRLFEYDCLSYIVARYLFAVRDDAAPAVQAFERACANAGRGDAMQVLNGSPAPGLIERVFAMRA
jgi:hypothetical protein